MEVVERAWAAGVFEGEGSIRINSVTKRNMGNLLCDVANTNEQIVRFLQERWGGTVTRYESEAPRKPFWRWRLSSRQASAFITDIMPFLVTDLYRERGGLALLFQSQKTGSRNVNRTDEYRRWQVAFYDEMKRLNVRGRAA